MLLCIRACSSPQKEPESGFSGVTERALQLLPDRTPGRGKKPCEHPERGNGKCVTSLVIKCRRILRGESPYTHSSHGKSFCCNSQLPGKSKAQGFTAPCVLLLPGKHKEGPKSGAVTFLSLSLSF